jgi:hypothetical protein
MSPALEALNSVMEKLVANDYVFAGMIASLLIVSALIVVYYKGYKDGYHTGYKGACDYVSKRVQYQEFGG